MNMRSRVYKLNNLVIEMFAGGAPYSAPISWFVTVTLVTAGDRPNLVGQQNFTDIVEAAHLFDEMVAMAAGCVLHGRTENDTFNLVNAVLQARYWKIYSRVMGDDVVSSNENI